MGQTGSAKFAALQRCFLAETAAGAVGKSEQAQLHQKSFWLLVTRVKSLACYEDDWQCHADAAAQARHDCQTQIRHCTLISVLLGLYAPGSLDAWTHSMEM